MTRWERLTYVLLTLPIARSVQIFKHSFPQNFHRKHFFYGSSSSLKTWINIFFYCETVGSLNIFGTSTLKRLLFDDKFSDLFGTSWISLQKNVLMYPSSEIWTNIT